MRIPPLYRKPSMQRLLAGMAIGGLVSWCIFLFIFGVWQEEYSKKIKKQSDLIKELEEDKKIWQEEFQKLNDKTQEQLTVQEIEVKITNFSRYKLDTYSVYEMENKIKEDLNDIEAKDIETVYKSRNLIKKTVENKILKANDKRYQVKITEMIVYTTISIQLEISFAN